MRDTPLRTRQIFDASPYPFNLGAARVEARPSGALWWEALRLLCVADLHLGKAERLARRGGPLLPPYETTETLTRLSDEVDRLNPSVIVCLGDSFDDARAPASLTDPQRATLRRLMAGRRWIWLAGNHDPAPIDLAGDHLAELQLDGVAFRHIAASQRAVGRDRRAEERALSHSVAADPVGCAKISAPVASEASGHYHPKATLKASGRRISRRCFLTDGRRVVLPAFGAYTGGLDAADPAFDALFGPETVALLLGRAVRAIPRAALIGNAAPMR